MWLFHGGQLSVKENSTSIQTMNLDFLIYEIIFLVHRRNKNLITLQIRLRIKQNKTKQTHILFIN